VTSYLQWINTVIDLLNLKKIFPSVTPVPNGNIQLEWEVDGNYLEIECEKDGKFKILRVQKEGQKDEKESQFKVDSILEVLDSVYWILKN